MSNITKPIILNETGVAIKEAIQGLQPDSAVVVTINGASMSLKQWITNCEACVYDSTYLGVKATITNLIDKKTFRVRLIGINHDVIASTDEGELEPSGEKAKTTWQFYDMPMQKVNLGLPFMEDPMGTSDEDEWVGEYTSDNPCNWHGYPTAVGLRDAEQQIFNSLPLELQRAIKTVRKDCHIPVIYYNDYRNYNSTASLIVDEMDRYGSCVNTKIFSLSATEVGIIPNPSENNKQHFPYSVEDNDGNEHMLEGTKYEYFNETYAYTSEANDDRRRPCKFNGEDWYYWLRTPDLDGSCYWGSVDGAGSVYINDTIIDSGVAPAFCI